MKRAVMCGILLFAGGCLFPAVRHLTSIAGPVQDFTPGGDQRIYAALELNRYMPDNATLFVEYGVDSCLVSTYRRGNEHYRTEIFAFKGTKGAMGAFLLDTAKGDKLNTGDRGTWSGNTARFVKGYYLVTVAPLEGGSESGVVALAAGLAKKISGGAITTDLFETMPPDNRVEGREYYFAGPLTFRKRFDRSLADALEIQHATEGVAITYLLEGHYVDLLRINFHNREESLSALNAYLASQKNRPRLLTDPNLMYTTVVNEDRTMNFIAEMGNRLYVMLNARDNKGGQNLFEFVIRGGI
jgi:hypothetical protein